MTTPTPIPISTPAPNYPSVSDFNNPLIQLMLTEAQFEEVERRLLPKTGSQPTSLPNSPQVTSLSSTTSTTTRSTDGPTNTTTTKSTFSSPTTETIPAITTLTPTATYTNNPPSLPSSLTSTSLTTSSTSSATSSSIVVMTTTESTKTPTSSATSSTTSQTPTSTNTGTYTSTTTSTGSTSSTSSPTSSATSSTSSPTSSTSPTAAPLTNTNTNTSTNTSTTTFAGKIPLSSQTTSGTSAGPTAIPNASSTVVGITFTPTQSSTASPTSATITGTSTQTPTVSSTNELTLSPTIYTHTLTTSSKGTPTNSPTNTLTSSSAVVAGRNISTTSTSTASGSTTKHEFSSTTLLMNATGTSSGFATSGSSSSTTDLPTLTATISPTSTLTASSTSSTTSPTSFTTSPTSSTTSTTASTTSPTSSTTVPPSTTYAVTTTSDKYTTTSGTNSTSWSSSSTTFYANDGKNSSSTTVMTPPTPTSTSTPLPIGTILFNSTTATATATATPTSSSTSIQTQKPTTFVMGTITPTTSPSTSSIGTVASITTTSNSPYSLLTTSSDSTTFSPTTSPTTTSWSSTSQGLTTTTTTTLPLLSTAQAPTTVEVTYGPTPGSTITTLTTLAPTTYASTSKTNFLAPTNSSIGLSPQATNNDLSVSSDSTSTMSFEQKLFAGFSIGIVLSCSTLGTLLQLVRWGNRLRDDVMTYRGHANRGGIDPDNYELIMQRSKSTINRLAYWLVTGKDYCNINYEADNSLTQTFKAIIDTNIAKLAEIPGALTSAVGSTGDAFSSVVSSLTPPSGTSSVMQEFAGDWQIADESSISASIQSIVPTIIGGTAQGGRRLGIPAPSIQSQEIPLIQSKDIRIFELWCLITKAQQLPYSDQNRADFLMQALGKYQQILFEGHISLYDLDTLQNNLAPTLQKELSDLTLMAANADPSARLTGMQSLNVGHLDGKQFIWDVNYTSGLAYDRKYNAGVQFMDLSKPVFINFASQSAKSVSLDAQHSQYLASNDNEFITIGGDIFAPSSTSYNVIGMAGNDIFSIAANTLGDNSCVNLLGGGGKNTYIIYGKGSWSSLASSIHIFDFDPSKDTIVLVTSDGAINLSESKRTLFSSTLAWSSIYPSGQVTLTKNDGFANDIAAWWQNKLIHSSSSFKAAEHVFTGEGMPTIVVDEANYNINNPDSIFSAIKTQQNNPSGQLLNPSSQLFINAVVNTQFGQLKMNGSSDLYAVHLNAGQSYVFTMSHKPGLIGDAALITRLALKDAQLNTIAIADTHYGDSRLDFVAINDGDFFLEANGRIGSTTSDPNAQSICSTSALTASQGKYAISAVEIPHNAYTIGTTLNDNFDGSTNHVGYKVFLSAGDYVSFSFTSDGSPNVRITDAQGVKVDAFTQSSIKQNNQYFLAQKSGDYFIDAMVDNLAVNKVTPIQLTSAVKDIEASKSTMASLSINSVIKSNIANAYDHDWFRVNLNGNQSYEFDIVSKNPQSKTHGVLKDAYGEYKQSIDQRSTDGYYHSKFTFDVIGKGPHEYFLDVSATPSTYGYFGIRPVDYTVTYHTATNQVI